VLGRYQLYTENTLTPVTMVLTRLASLPALLRNWGVVLAANMIGASIIAALLAFTGIFEPAAVAVALELGEHALATSWSALFWKGVIAGWLVASMVWLVHAARDSVSRFFIIFFVMYLIPSTDLYHCIIGFCEAMYLVLHGDAGIAQAVGGFFVPVLLGNTAGGVLLVAILNYAQTRDNRFPNRDCEQMELSWREWLFEIHTGTDAPERATNGNGAAPSKQNKLVAPISPDDHRTGAPDAPVTLVQYGDYECPNSHEIYLAIKDLEHHFGDSAFQYVYRHFPLSRSHPNAINAAIAAEAAAEQGRFWDMHDKLFLNQDRLEEADLLGYARALNLNMAAFEEDLLTERHRQHVEKDRETGKQSGVRSTANLFINGERYQGELSFEALVDKLENQLEQVRV
jgi:protein-disulfide isomerase